MNNIKHNIYKTLSISLLAASAIVMPACKKSFLDVPQQAQTPVAQFWNSADDANKAVNAIYGNLRSWNNIAFAPMAIESLGSDDAEKGSTANDATYLNQYDDYSVPATEGQLDSFWDGQYQTINLANQVLDNVPGITMDATFKARLLGEAKFIRAYAYFRLVRAFGDVPLRLTVPKDPNDYNMPRTPKAQIWTAIESDLNDAASALPQTYAAADLGRATKGAALGLHAKVAMYLQKWNDVFSYTNQVMGLGYSLLSNYEKVFRLENENSSESLFEVQAALLPNNQDASNSQYSQIQGVRNVAGGGWGFNVPTQNLADSYETGDPRRAGTIIFRGTTTFEGDVIPANTDNPRYNYKSYVPFSLWVSGFNEGAQQNFRVLRYSDVLLMNAEAANELGNTAQALSSLEVVRARARQGNASILPRVTTTDKSALRDAIWRERRSELAMENDRYFDVIRQGRAAQVFGAKGWKANKNEVWPVPQTEIDLSRGVLTQNPGY